MEVETVLVPVDDSIAAMEAVRYAVAVAERYDAGIHALYLLDELEGPDASDAIVDDIREAAGDVAFNHSAARGFDTHTLTHHPGSVVLDAVDDVGADFIVIPREDPSDLLGRVAEYVLQYADHPVLSV